MLDNIGLVLEGGGMRGVFTSGVLDRFIDAKLFFPYVIGVSAGGSNGLSYASRQRGRARACNIDVLKKRPYIGLSHLFRQGCIMDYEFLFGELPREMIPYDFEAYENSGRYVLVATNCITGKAQYFEKSKTTEDLLKVCRASCSLPYVCTTVDIGGVPFLDGGIADAIPIRKSIADGFFKNVVVLTRNEGYRKSEKFPSMFSFLYTRYPKLRKALARKNEIYNETMDLVEALEVSGDAVVIRPRSALKVDRLERDCSKLEALYREGYECASEALGKICLLAGAPQSFAGVKGERS